MRRTTLPSDISHTINNLSIRYVSRAKRRRVIQEKPRATTRRDPQRVPAPTPAHRMHRTKSSTANDQTPRWTIWKGRGADAPHVSRSVHSCVDRARRGGAADENVRRVAVAQRLVHHHQLRIVWSRPRRPVRRAGAETGSRRRKPAVPGALVRHQRLASAAVAQCHSVLRRSDQPRTAGAARGLSPAVSRAARAVLLRRAVRLPPLHRCGARHPAPVPSGI